jgi:hypothetical protein
VSLVKLAPLLLTGCATLFASGPDRVPVMTNPPGAYVYLNGRPVGQTPMQLMLDRDADANIQIYLPGFAPVHMTRDKGFNAWFIGSCVMFFLIVPPIVDLIAGNHRKFEEDTIALGLTPLAAPPPQYQQQPQPYPVQQPDYTPPPTAQPPNVQPPAAPPRPKT